MYYLDVKVHCVSSPAIRHQKISIPYAIVDGKNTYFRNEGCDSLSGDIACKKCVEALYQMFKNGYEYKLGEVIFPDVKLVTPELLKFFL